MELKIDKKTVKRLAIAAIIVLVIYWLLSDGERVQGLFDNFLGIMTPFIVGAVLAFILNVPVRGFEKLLKGIKNDTLRRLVALILTLLCVCLVLVGVFMLLIPEIKSTLIQIYPNLERAFNNTVAWVQKMLKDYPQIQEIIGKLDLSAFNWAAIGEKFIAFVSSSLSSLFPQAVSVVGSLAGALISGFISIAFAFYSIFQKETLARQGRKVLYAILPEKASDYIVRVLRLANSTFSNFLSGQCVEVCILGTMFFVAMSIFRIPHAALVSVLTAVTAFIPVVGAWFGCITGAVLIAVSNPVLAFWFVILSVVVQQLENNFVYPRVVGTSVGLSGMWVLLAVGLGGEMMGVVGMFLMIPCVSVVYALVREAVNNRLKNKEVPSEKLEAQPPELQSHFKLKIEDNKKKRAHKKSIKNNK